MGRANWASSCGRTHQVMLEPKSAEQHQTELLRRIAAQDHQALADLYDQLSGPLFSTAIHILGDQREAEEVIQDVFVQIWNRAASFDSELGVPFHWTLGITRHRCIDYLRARQRRTRLLDDATTETEILSRPAASTSAHDALSEGELARVRATVQTLPPDQKQAIELAFFGGMTHQEIAETLGEPLGTIKARIRRGMIKLKESLKAYV
jgi:RNA polymerase sigma-70 factor, ECF subfamily